jgi:hypothetical protein
MEFEQDFLENDLQEMRYSVMITTDMAWKTFGIFGGSEC